MKRMYFEGFWLRGPSRPKRCRILVARTVCSQSSMNSHKWPSPVEKKKHRLRKKWNFHTLAAIWNFSTFYQESFSSNYVVKERKHTAADIQKDRSYLEKSALQAITFLIAKTISNKVWGLCLPRKLARVSFSRKKKKLKAALIGSLMGAILLRVWRNLSRQFASRFLLSTKILVLATSSSFYLFEKSSARGLQSIQKSY